ncbi:MAG: hypothetical protein JWM91_2813 [Rhodospirillales bacterium]|nr:hypothetical protein [Rhodospirillales bacterium]
MFRGRRTFQILLIAIAVSAVFVASPRVLAESYMTVSDVPVDVTAKNSAAARDQAIAAAQAKAFDRLVKRLVPKPADQARLKPSQQEIEGFVQDFAVESERVSSVRYIAQFNVRFRAGRVNKYLADSGVSAVGDQQQALIVPIYKTSAGTLLWENGNRWRAAWDRGGFGDGPVTLILPNGDAFDTGTLSAAAAGSGDMGAIAALSQRYHAAGVVVAVAEPRDSARGAVSGLALTITTYDQGGTRGTQTLTVDPVAGEQADKTLLRGVGAVASELENGWRQTIASSGSTGLHQATPVPSEAADQTLGAGSATAYPIAVSVAGIGDWIKLRNQLIGTAGVQRVALDAVTRDGAAVTLDFAGDPLALQAALAGSGYVLVQTSPGNAAGPGIFKLRPAGSASAGSLPAQ